MQRRKRPWLIVGFVGAALFLLCLLFCFAKPNKIVGTIHGADMERIIVNNVSYTTSNTPYSIKDKGEYIGKAAWIDGEAILDLYRIKGDEDFNYLYAFLGFKGQIYQRENMINE